MLPLRRIPCKNLDLSSQPRRRQEDMAPEVFASEMAAFEMYWHRQTQLLEDVCRQAGRLPELFFTLAPAEWKFQLHEGVLSAERNEELSSMQLLLTMHLYNALQAVLRRLIFENGDALEACGIEEVEHWCMRFEFQKRGTIHVPRASFPRDHPWDDLIS